MSWFTLSFSDAPVRRALQVLLQGEGPVWATQLRLRQAESMTLAHRVVLLPRLPAPEYAALLAAAEVVLDTLPYSSFTITIEALTMGAPVVTLPCPTVRG